MLINGGKMTKQFTYGYSAQDFNWAIAGDMGGRSLSSTVVGVLDWAVYMGAAIQASVFGFVKEAFGWSAVFVTIGSLYIVLLVLTLFARKMKMRKL